MHEPEFGLKIKRLTSKTSTKTRFAMRLVRIFSTYTIVYAVLLLTTAIVEAQDKDQTGPLETANPPSLDVEEPSEGNTKGTKGYGDEGRRIGTPVDVERDLDFSFPKRDYILHWKPTGRSFFDQTSGSRQGCSLPSIQPLIWKPIPSASIKSKHDYSSNGLNN